MVVWEKRPIYIFLLLGHLHATSLAPSFSHDTLHIQIQTHTPVLSTPSFFQPSLPLSRLSAQAPNPLSSPSQLLLSLTHTTRTS
jgi:hypothetical protein